MVASILSALLPTCVALDVKKQSNPSHVGNLNKKLHRRDLQGSNCLLFEMVDCVSNTQSWYAEVWTWAGCIPSETDYPTAIYTVSDSAYWWEGKTTYWTYESTSYWATIDSEASPSSLGSVGNTNTGATVYGGHDQSRVGSSGYRCQMAYFAKVTSKPQVPVDMPNFSSVNSESDLSQGIIIAIAVGVVVLCLALLVGVLYYRSKLLRDKRSKENNKLQKKFGTSVNELSTQPDSELPVPTHLQFIAGADDVSTLEDATIFQWRMGGRSTKAGPSIPGYGNKTGKSGNIFDIPHYGVPVLSPVDDLTSIANPLEVIADVEDGDKCEQHNVSMNHRNHLATGHTVPWTTKM